MNYYYNYYYYYYYYYPFSPQLQISWSLVGPPVWFMLQGCLGILIQGLGEGFAWICNWMGVRFAWMVTSWSPGVVYAAGVSGDSNTGSWGGVRLDLQLDGCKVRLDGHRWGGEVRIPETQNLDHNPDGTCPLQSRAHQRHL